jgi:lipopolysaccharide exporter
MIVNFGMVHYLIGDFVGDFSRNIAKPIIFCLIMVGLISLYKLFVGESGLMNVLAEIGIGGAAYLLLTLTYKLSYAELNAYRQGTL